jgi:hypothetical protein
MEKAKLTLSIDEQLINLAEASRQVEAFLWISFVYLATFKTLKTDVWSG